MEKFKTFQIEYRAWHCKTPTFKTEIEALSSASALLWFNTYYNAIPLTVGELINGQVQNIEKIT